MFFLRCSMLLFPCLWGISNCLELFVQSGNRLRGRCGLHWGQRKRCFRGRGFRIRRKRVQLERCVCPAFVGAGISPKFSGLLRFRPFHLLLFGNIIEVMVVPCDLRLCISRMQVDFWVVREICAVYPIFRRSLLQHGIISLRFEVLLVVFQLSWLEIGILQSIGLYCSLL